LQLEPLPSTPQAVAQAVARDSAAWGPLIRQLGLNND
jgi:tripartite-type tricarboxylate transporter receptor subunit TctC